MTSTQLQLLPPAVEGAHRKSQRLLAEARACADEQVVNLQQALFRVAELAGDVGQGGDAYPAGVRDLAAKIAGDAGWCGKTLQPVMRNVGRAASPDFASAQ